MLNNRAEPAPQQREPSTGDERFDEEQNTELSLEERLERAVGRFDERIEGLISSQPKTRGEAEAVLDQLDFYFNIAQLLDQEPGADPESRAALLEESMNVAGARERKKAFSKMRGTQVDSKERQKYYDRQQAIGKNLPLSSKNGRKPSGVIRDSWLGRGDNRKRTVEFYYDLSRRITDLPRKAA